MAAAMPGRIPWSVAAAWGERHGRGPDDLDFLLACLAAMDEVFTEWWVERQKVRQ